MTRRRLLQSAAAAALGPAACSQKHRAPLPFATLADLSAMLKAGQTTPVLLVEHCLERIAQIDKTGPRLNAVIELNPAVKALAAASRSGALHGLPILIKDNIETADEMQTTAGSLALRDHKPKQDAALVTRLREAGALILGKTNLSEWANIRSPNSTSGWSARGGLTRNPHRLTHARVPALRPPWRRDWHRRQSGRRRTAPSSARRAPVASWDSNPPSASSAAAGSFPSPTGRTRRGR